MDIVDTLILALVTGVAGFFGSYANTIAKNLATKADFNNLKDQLSQNTTVVESIKSQFSNKSWVSQQVWVKKQEAYEDILQNLLHIQKYVNHQWDDYQDYEYVNYLYHISIESEFEPEEVDKATFDSLVTSDPRVQEAQGVEWGQERALSRDLNPLNL